MKVAFIKHTTRGYYVTSVQYWQYNMHEDAKIYFRATSKQMYSAKPTWFTTVEEAKNAAFKMGYNAVEITSDPGRDI
jgi:hypothetical protein